MIEIVTNFISFMLTGIGYTFVKHGRKIQTAFVPVLTFHTLVAISLYLFLSYTSNISPISIAIFWVGAFVFWFNVHTLFESSILLKMLYMLKLTHPMTKTELLNKYEAHCSLDFRIEELIKGEFIERLKEGFNITRKGRFIVKIFSIITYMWQNDDFVNSTK